mmetsp:Transcript_46942/g.147230  ORF Transcript_46942/g.147230 Transcript_46942/m.147230 type:complete len:282 (+) Transcript_46942:1004-1849(+)
MHRCSGRTETRSNGYLALCLAWVAPDGQCRRSPGGGPARKAGAPGCIWALAMDSECTPEARGRSHIPRRSTFFCGQLILLSSEHLMLILGFLVGWALFAIQFWDFVDGGAGTRLASVLSLVELLIAELCLVTMLLKFEEIDIVQQLEREVKELAKQNERVEKQRERMHGFWNNVQQLTELWLYRTVPRLDLFKEIHSLLEDTTEDLLMKISSANQHLEDLENRLGDLTAWRNNGTVSIEAKKGFGKAVNQICQEQELDECLVKLEDLTSGGMEALTNSNAK